MATGAEFGGVINDPELLHQPGEMLKHFNRLAAEFDAEIRRGGLSDIIKSFAPDFNPEDIPEGEEHRAELLRTAGNLIGGKTYGRARCEVKVRPLTEPQDVYVQDLATYIGARFPGRPNNIDTHRAFVDCPAEQKLVVGEGGADLRAEVIEGLFDPLKAAGYAQIAGSRAIAVVKPVLENGVPKKGDNGEDITEPNPEYKVVTEMCRPAGTAAEHGVALGGLSGLFTVAGRQPDSGPATPEQGVSSPVFSGDTTEYEVFRTHIAMRAAPIENPVLPNGLRQASARLDAFLDGQGRQITLIEPLGDKASLIDGARTYLNSLKEAGALPRQLAVLTSGLYVPQKELAMSRLVAKEFPQIESLHIIGDETGKRSGGAQLNEIARLLRQLADFLSEDVYPHAVSA